MPFYVQHDEAGNIMATRIGDYPSDHPREIELAEWQETELQRVNVDDKVLEDDPVLVKKQADRAIYSAKLMAQEDAAIAAAVADVTLTNTTTVTSGQK